jgi:hypothetical protein|tara:strand:- start:212 stop:625 length:414 start_codon:yes stop_codon:yes gene_type:complete
MKVKEIDRNLLEKVRDEISHCLEPIGEKHGIELKLGRCSYSSGNFTMKLEGSLVGDDGVVLTKEAEDFKKYAHWHGLEPEDLGKTFVQAHVVYTITGLKTRARKYPITAKASNGGSYKFAADSVKRLLKGETLPASQ